MKRSIAGVCAGLALFAAAPAGATPLAPTKASDVVVLRASGSGATCLPMGGGIDVDLQVLPDGTVVPYAPPAGKALVITGFDWSSTGGTPGVNALTAIRLAGSHGPAPLVFATGASSDASGTAVESAIVPNVSVFPGVTVCVGTQGASIGQVVVHGFHTVAK